MKFYSLFVLFLLVMFSSCTIEKRRYMDGYHVEWNRRNNVQALVQNDSERRICEAAESAVAEENAPVEVQTEPMVVACSEEPVQQTVDRRHAIAERGNAQGATKSDKKPGRSKSARKLLRSEFSYEAHIGAQTTDYARVDDILLLILALFVSPLAVYLHEGNWNTTCWINLILWICFILPGAIHAFIVILL